MPFQVIGTIQRIGHGNNADFNLRLIMPFSTMATYFPMKGEGNAKAIKYVAYQPVIPEQHERAKKSVRAIIARNHNFDPETPDAFDDWDSIASAEMVGKISDAMDAFLGAVGLVTLALGAMGVVNIMLVSVAERTREIGLRKALGATRRNILLQFFLEGLMLTSISGAVGVGAQPTGSLGSSDSLRRSMVSNCHVFTQRLLCLPSGASPLPGLSPDSIPHGGRLCSRRWKLFDRRGLASLCGASAEPATQRSHHAGYGLGNRYRRPFASLRDGFFGCNCQHI